jgi:hypothetical protein
MLIVAITGTCNTFYSISGKEGVSGFVETNYLILLYRLSLAKMKSIEEGMRDGREVAWKATCGYSFATGQPTTDDVVQSSFNTLNLFSFTTHGKFAFS